ncbi:MAG: hypothetical protein LBD34_00135 [Puniceicoccales bacterium]|nr:hypothetical protein [Puniceicoccales bacterium]
MVNSKVEGVVWESRAVRQIQELREMASEYEASVAGRPLEEREVTLLVRGQVIRGQLVVDEVEAQNHLNPLPAAAVRGSKWGKMVIGAAGIILGVVLQLNGNDYDATAYGIALALILSAMENIFIDKIKRPDPALRG